VPGLGHDRVIKSHTPNLDTILASGKTVVWLVPHGLVGHVIAGRLAPLSDELKSLCLLSRFFGGFIADDEEWVAACEEMHPVLNKVPQPIACMKAAVEKPLELVIDASVGAEAAWATKALDAVDGIKNPSSKWILRPNRKAIKNDTSARVLMANADIATADAENKKKANEKVKKRKAALSGCVAPAAKAKAKAKLASAVEKRKTLRGKSLSLESFGDSVAVFV